MPSSALQNYHCHYSFYFFFAFLLRTALSSVDTLELWGGRAAPWAWQGLSTVPVCSPPTAGTPRCCHSPWAWQELRPQLCPSCAPAVPLCCPCLGVTRWWPRGGPEALCPMPTAEAFPWARFPDSSQLFSRGPRPLLACATRANGEGKQKTKTQQNLSQMPVLLNIKRLFKFFGCVGLTHKAIFLEKRQIN